MACKALWDNFLNAVEKAKTACEAAGEKIEHHFADVGKMIDLAKGAQRRVEDFALTRYACYLIAQNGDPPKSPRFYRQTHPPQRSRQGPAWPAGYPTRTRMLSL